MSKAASYLDSNGLVDGKIPQGKPCPFLTECKMMLADRCPSESHQPPGPYSCGAARLWSITIQARKNGEPCELLERVRDQGK